MTSVQIPIARIGHGLTITFGHCLQLKNRECHLEKLDSSWLSEFMQEFKIGDEGKEYLKFTLVLKQEGTCIRAEGEIEAWPQLECIRSLTLFRQKLVIPVSAIFLPESRDLPTIAEEDGILLTASDFDTYYYKNNSIELDEMLLDSLQTSIPDSPLCDVQCKGICTECGKVLNNLTSCGTQALCPNLHFFN